MEARQTPGFEVRGVFLQVLFRTDMAVEEALRKVEEPTVREFFQRVPGLWQKYYVRDPVTGEIGGIYLFDSRESLERFRASCNPQEAIQTFNPLGPPAFRVFEIGGILFEEKPVATQHERAPAYVPETPCH